LLYKVVALTIIKEVSLDGLVKVGILVDYSITDVVYVSVGVYYGLIVESGALWHFAGGNLALGARF